MKSKAIAALMTVIFLLCSSAVLHADVVTLKSGKIIKGEIIEKNDEFLAVEVDAKTQFIDMEDVETIEETRLEVAEGSIVEVEGAVDVLAKGEEEWIPAEEGMTLNEGDSIRTGPDSKTIATFADQVIVAMEPDTSVNVEKLQKSPRDDLRMNVQLSKGQIWNDVGKLRSKHSNFYINTSAAVTGVRGTIFTVKEVPQEKTTVGVVDGGVGVRTRGMKMDPTKVKKDQQTEVTPNNPPLKPMALSGGFLAQWALYQAKFGLLRGGLGAQGFSPTGGQAAAGAAGAGGVIAGVAALSKGDSGGDGSSRETVVVMASNEGGYSQVPIDTNIDGSREIGDRTVTRVEVDLLCFPDGSPDQFQIIYMGNTIGDSGMIGSPTEQFLLEAGANGSSTVVTIRVITSPESTTWYWDAEVTYFVE